MSYIRSHALNMGWAEFYTRLISIVILVVVLQFVSGCGGADRKAPKEAVELDPSRQRIADWHALMREKRDAPEVEKLESVNSFFNQLKFVDDLSHWGKDDYWATPQEMLASNGGDCEDFTTAKYFTLRQIGIPDKKMRLTYVKSLTLNQPHMVLSYYAEPTADPLILDNLIKTILYASQRVDLIPVYSFNGQGLWLTKKQSSDRLGGTERLNLWQESPLGGAERLSLWQELQSRFSKEVLAAPLPK
jgi:predicted transglutaminase-like cysteine proteinase